MEKLYCTIFIVDVSSNPEEVDTVTSRVQQLIEDHGGEIKRKDMWGKRRLAYSIQNKTSGFYVELEFSANSHLNIPKIIEKEYNLNDKVLRHLTYVVSKEELLQREMNSASVGARSDDNSGEAEKPKSGRSAGADKEDNVKKSAPERKAEAETADAVQEPADAPQEESAEETAPADEQKAPEMETAHAADAPEGETDQKDEKES